MSQERLVGLPVLAQQLLLPLHLQLIIIRLEQEKQGPYAFRSFIAQRAYTESNLPKSMHMHMPARLMNAAEGKRKFAVFLRRQRELQSHHGRELIYYASSKAFSRKQTQSMPSFCSMVS